MDRNESQKLAVITGGDRGLGRSMALHLADNGVSSIITYRTGAADAQEVVALIEAKGCKAVALPLDVSEVATFEQFAEGVAASLHEHFAQKTFRYLINNAGIGHYANIVDTTEDAFDRLMRIHLKGPFFLTQKLLPLMQDGGSILNVSSGLARFALPGYSAYAMMKGGIEVMSRYLAKELGQRQITANTLAPGAIATDFGGGHVRDNADINRAIAAQTALGRVGLPDDIGAVVAALLSNDCHWINGQRIEASGGMLI